MQTNTTKKRQNNKTTFLMLVLVLLIGLTFGIFANLNFNSVLANNAIIDKAYKYTISQENNLYVLKGKRINSEEYVLTDSALHINEVIGLIETDRKISANEKAEVEITFNNLDLGNSSILFNDGEYVLKGVANFANISANPCIVLSSNAHLTLGGVVLSNQGFSALIEVNGASLDINACNLNSNQEVLIANSASIVNIFGSTLTANDASAISSINESSTNKPQIKIGSNSKIISNSTQPAMMIKNVVATIQTAEIKSINSNYALINQGEGLKLVQNPTFISKKNAFSTDMFFSTEDNGVYYSGNGIKVYYSGEISVADVAIVINPSTDLISKIQILNSGIALRESYLSIYMSRQFTVTYHANCNDSVVTSALPKDNNKYFNLSEVQVEYMDLNVRDHFEFAGWSKKTNPSPSEIISNGNVIIEGENLNLYAVWRPITYSITYLGLDGAENNNPNEYDYGTNLNLVAPIKQYYDFVGWQITGVDGIHSSLSLPYSNLNNIELMPIFKLSEYSIIYHNLTSEQISKLNLKTKYNIQDENLILSNQNYLLNGYSYFGVYSNAELTNSFAGKSVSFLPNSVNDFGFIVGQDLNVFVNMRQYHSGIGDGSASNPFVLENLEQFKTLLTGKKLETQEKTYITLNNDITVGIDEELPFVTLKNYVFNGNNKSLLVENLIRYSNLSNEEIFSIFPRLDGCEIKDLTVKNAENISKLELSKDLTSEKLEISLLVHNLVSSTISNVYNNLIIESKINSNASKDEIRISGIAGVAVSSLLNSVKFNGKIEIKSSSFPSTIYACGLICESQNSIVLNSKFTGNLTCDNLINPIKNNVCFYFAGIGILMNSNLIINSSSQGRISCNANENICILSGIAINLGKWNEINNCLSLSSVAIHKNGELKSNQKAISCSWGIADNITLQNVLCLARDGAFPVCVLNKIKQNSGVEEFTSTEYANLVHLQKLESGKENAKNTLNSFAQNLDFLLQDDLILASWENHNNEEQENSGIFGPVLKITVRDVESGKEKTYTFETNTLPGYVYIIKDGYLFKNYSFDAEGKQIVTDLTKLKGDIVVYANYITFNDYIWQNFIWWLICGIIILIALIVFVVFCELKKRVIFIFDGEVVGAEKVRINDELPKVKGKEDILWFKDGNGNKPFTKTKMPFVWRELKLISFKDEIRLPLEKLYEQERLAKELLVLQKQKIKDQKHLLKQENKAKNKLNKQQETIKKNQKSNAEEANVIKKSEKPETKQTSAKKKSSATTSKKSKNKTKQEIENSGITIVKKEIKTLPKSSTLNSSKNKKDK